MRDEGPDEVDADLEDQGDQGDQGEGTFGCPACGEMIWEEAEQCPECGHWVSSRERVGNERNRGWRRVIWVVVVVVVIVTFVLSQV